MGFDTNSVYTQSNGSASNNAQVIYFATVDPTEYDTAFPIQKQWYNTTTNNLWILINFTTQTGIPLANWQSLGSDLDVLVIDGDSGSASPVDGVVKVSGGSTGLTTLGSGSTLDLTGILLPASGGTGVNNGSSTITIGGDFAMSGAFTFTGTLTGNTAVTFPTSGTLATTSESAITFDGDTGSATPTGGVITFHATAASGSSVSFSATSHTVTLNVSDVNGNTIIGSASGNGTLSGNFNVGLGTNSLVHLTTGASNTALGTSVLTAVTSGVNNNALGNNSLTNLLTGQRNNCIGCNAGSNYTGAESSNILLGDNNSGTLGESNVLRVGISTGSGSGQLAKAFISGINGVTSSSPAIVTTNTSTDQLGTIPYIQNGTFTPVIAFGGQGPTSYTSQTGTYTQIGNLIFFDLLITINVLGTASGNAIIGGLPTFTGSFSNASIYDWSGITLTTNYTDLYILAGFPAAGNLSLTQSGSGQTAATVTNTSFANGSTLRACGFLFAS